MTDWPYYFIDEDAEPIGYPPDEEPTEDDRDEAPDDADATLPGLRD